LQVIKIKTSKETQSRSRELPRFAAAGKVRAMASPKTFEVHLFLGSATAKESAGLEWTPGADYSLLILARQPEGEAPDEALARRSASAAGWMAIKLERSRRLPATAMPEGEALRAAFREALDVGSAVVAYREPLRK